MLFLNQVVFFSVAAAAVDLNGIKTLLASGLSTYFINSKPTFISGRRHSPYCFIFHIWVFDNFILADNLFAKALWRFTTCLLVNNNLCGKLVSSLELSIISDEVLRVTLVSFFTANFNFLSCEYDNLTFTVILSNFYINVILKENKFIILLQFLVKNLK